ncbi:type II secretion system protein GspM [Parapusillimonas granuli]|uniref:Type II secretion system protein M n=1 Tax=Parapusillimonas granuli TaxID=380911 RepID=A0A853G067_9BURK|nr:type II secretion system protein GspM [Parapusillimonas granuli]MBB5214197.1 general secretion pathway protein M [Parapusillimonas granuli]NYT50618.1 type II secretion system protein M [Parapusillimonas granuli]
MTRPSSAPAAGSPAPWRQQLARLNRQTRAWWAERTSRERLLLRAAALAVGLALAWAAGLKPALRDIEQVRERLPRLRADAAQVDALILEAQALAHRRSGRLDADELAEALGAGLRRAGLEASATLNEISGPESGSPRQWEILLSGADAERAMEWLSGLPYLLRLRVHAVELRRASMDGRDRPGHVSGRIVVGPPAEGSP